MIFETSEETIFEGELIAVDLDFIEIHCVKLIAKITRKINFFITKYLIENIPSKIQLLNNWMLILRYKYLKHGINLIF